MPKKMMALLLGLSLLAQALPVWAAATEEVDLREYEATIIASESQISEGNVPVNTVDGTIDTKWAAEGHGQWLRFQLAEETELTEIGFAFTSGAERIYTFSVETSLDAENWTTVFDGHSSGKSNEIEMFSLTPSKAGYVRYVGRGNSVNNWNNISEVAGLNVKRIPVNLYIDGKIVSLTQEPVIREKTVLFDAEKMLQGLGYTCSYDAQNQVLLAENGETTLRFDYRTGSASRNGTPIGDKEQLMLSGNAPLLAYDILLGVEYIEANYDPDEKSVTLITESYVRLQEAYRKIDEEFLGVFDWLYQLYDPESGGFYNSVSGATYEGFYPSVEATVFAHGFFNDKNRLGGIEYMPDEVKQKIAHFIQINQNPETGFWEEPEGKALTRNERDHVRLYENAVSKLKTLGAKPLYPLPSERNSTANSPALRIIASEEDSSALPRDTEAEEAEAVIEAEKQQEEEAAGITTDNTSHYFDNDTKVSLPAGVPSYCATVNQFIAHVASYGWRGDTWTAGDKTYEDLTYVLMLDKSVQQHYIDATIQWLNEHQNPESFYWDQNGSIGFNAVSGAFKVCRVYDRFKVAPPNAYQIAETVMKTLRSGDTAQAACYVRNPLSVLEIVKFYDRSVQEMIEENEAEIVTLYADYIRSIFHADGGASSTLYQSQNKFGGMAAGLMVCEGDIDGTLQMFVARYTIAALFGRTVDNSAFEEHYKEFWDRILAKEPIVKKPYRAESGFVYEENFESYEAFDELLNKNWGFLAADTELVKEEDNTYLLVNDKVETNLEGARVTFPRIYEDGEIELRVKFDRDVPYSAKGNDLNYSQILLRGLDRSPIRIDAVDSGSNRITLACEYKDGNDNIAYRNFATVGRNEWFTLKFTFGHDADGKVQVKYYINGKLQTEITNIYAYEAEYVDGLDVKSSASRCSRIAIDDIKITVK